MEVTLVHPDDKETKVVATHPVQVAAFKGRGFVEESELVDLEKDADEEVKEVEKLRAELAEAQKKTEEAEKRAEAAEAKTKKDADEKAKAEAEASKKEKETK